MAAVPTVLEYARTKVTPEQARKIIAAAPPGSVYHKMAEKVLFTGSGKPVAAPAKPV